MKMWKVYDIAKYNDANDDDNDDEEDGQRTSFDQKSSLVRGPSFKQTLIYFTQGCIFPCLVKIVPMVLEKQILKFRKYNFTLSLLSSLGKVWGPSFEQTWIPLILVPKLVEIGTVVLEKKNMWKVTDTDDDDNNDDDEQRTNWDHKLSLDPSVQVR